METGNPDDAFGLFSVMAQPPRGANADGSQTAQYKGADGRSVCSAGRATCACR